MPHSKAHTSSLVTQWAMGGAGDLLEGLGVAAVEAAAVGVLDGLEGLGARTAAPTKSERRT